MPVTNAPRSPLVPVGIRGFGYQVPNQCLTNQDLAKLGSPVTPDWIVRKTGIHTRHVAEDNEAMSDLVVPAAATAIHSAGLAAADLDTLLVSGDFHDSGGVQLTSTSVAQQLGISDITCLDLRAGCPSSVMALHVGTALVGSGLTRRALIAAGEINTRDIDYTDRTAVWFGDGAGAVILEPCSPDTGILVSFVAGTGEGSEILTIPAGGSREPLTAEGLAAGRHHLQMNGRAVFPFAVEAMVNSLEKVTNYLGTNPQQLDWIVPHQANLRIIEAAIEKLQLSMDQVYVNLDRVGNTAGASVLLALAEGLSTGVIQPGDLVATVGFGGGLAWGAQVIRMNHSSDFKPAHRVEDASHASL